MCSPCLFFQNLAFWRQKIREAFLAQQESNAEEEEDDGKTEKKVLYIFLAIVSAFFSLCVLAILFPPGFNPIQFTPRLGSREKLRDIH